MQIIITCPLCFYKFYTSHGKIYHRRTWKLIGHSRGIFRISQFDERKNIFTCVFGIHNIISLPRPEQVDGRWWEKHLSKRSLLKLTCLWHDKLTILPLMTFLCENSQRLLAVNHFCRKAPSYIYIRLNIYLRSIYTCSKYASTALVLSYT